jgi:hypothetical protein
MSVTYRIDAQAASHALDATQTETGQLKTGQLEAALQRRRKS